MAASVGCAGNIPTTRHGVAAGEWNMRLPTTRSTIGGLAYGEGGNSERAAAVAAEPAPLIAAAKVDNRAKLAPRHTRAAAPSIASAAFVPSEEQKPSAEPAPTSVTTPVATQQPVMLAQADDDPSQRYSGRQAQSRQLEQYKGGDAIVITAGALVVVLLIVLLILLLT
jgi:hypothetical protein